MVLHFRVERASPFSGAGRGTRTPGPLITNQLLYQLSYAGPLIDRLPIRAEPRKGGYIPNASLYISKTASSSAKSSLSRFRSAITLRITLVS